MALAFVMAQVAGGGYVSIFKTIPLLLVLLAWSRLLTWADKDAPAAHLPRIPLNVGMLCGMILAFALFLFLPGFLIAFPTLLLIFIAEIVTYLAIRHRKVGIADLKEQLRTWIKSFTERKKEASELPDAVQLISSEGKVLPPPERETPERSAYDALQLALGDPMRKNADQIDMTPAEGGMVVKYLVDGVVYKGEVLERGDASTAIRLLKGAAGLDVSDRRKPQRGMMKLSVDGKRRDVRLNTAGTTAGESMRIEVEPGKRFDLALDQLGLSEPQLGQLRKVMKEQKGIVLVSTPKDHGLTSMLYGIMRAHDAFLTHVHTIERAPDQDLMGITQNKLAANATAADELKQTDWVISQEPDVLLLSRVDSPKTAVSLIKFAKEGKLVYVGMNAASTFEAMDAWRKLVGDDRLAMSQLELVMNGRVLRRLCSACKVGYMPDPGTLRKLNINAEQVNTLFQARSQPIRDAKGNPVPCDFCHDLRFKGRMGVFEMFVIDDEVRQLVASGATINQVKAKFRKQRAKYLQEEALALVEKGETSVQEVLRVLKSPESKAPLAAAPAAAS